MTAAKWYGKTRGGSQATSKRKNAAKSRASVWSYRMLGVRAALVAAVLLVAGVSCSGSPSGERAGKPAAIESVRSMQAALTADDLHPTKPFRDSVVRTVLPGSSLTSPDSLRGVADVGRDGAGTYRIPIEVPDGIAGMQPVMDIEYHGRRGPGLLGPGWNISGLSAIVRCRRDVAHDGNNYIATGENGVPRFLADNTFCLDGTRVIYQEGSSASSSHTGAEYLSEMGSPTKVVVTAHDNTSGPLRLAQPVAFKAFFADGRIAYYGTTAASRIEAGNRRYAFYVERIEDRFGNSMRFSYTRATPTSTTDTMRVVEPMPDKIIYTGQGASGGDHELAFSYIAAARTRVRYIETLSIETKTVLSSIAVSSKFASFDAAGLPLNGVIRLYRFQYDPPATAPPGSAFSILKQIEKCTATQNSAGAWVADVCTTPTRLFWSANSSLQYERLTLNDSIADVVPTGAQNYARLTPVDLNNDGRDDLVYKVAVDASCAKWVYRLSSGRSFGAAVDTGLPNTCSSSSNVGDKFLSDIFPVNLDGRGAVDFLVPIQTTQGFNGYSGVLTGVNAGGAPTFPRFDFDAMASTAGGSLTRNDPNVGFGEFSPLRTSVLRPNIAAGATSGQWRAYELTLNASAQPVINTTINVGQYLRKWPPVYTDLNGDGMDELLTPDSQVSIVVATPTTIGANLPVLRNFDQVTGRYWFIDVNGDGLRDVAYITASDAKPGSVVRVRMNKGDFTFGPDIATTLNAGFNIGVSGIRSGIDTGVRVADVNLDGLDDMLLVDNGVELTSGVLSNGSFTARRSRVEALLSRGDGTFSTATPAVFGGSSVPLGDPATGFNGVPAPLQGYRLTQTLDADGDGLTDIVQTEGGRLRLYLRMGAAPQMLNTVIEGNARQIDYTLSAVTETSRFTSTSPCRQAAWPRTCAQRGFWVVTDLAISGPLPRNLAYTYQDGYSDRAGRGFEGFASRTITDTQRGSRTQISFSDRQLEDTSTFPAKYFYLTNETVIDSVRVPGGKLHRTTTTRPFENASISQKRFFLNSKTVQVETADCTESSNFACSTSPRRLSLTNSSFTYDSMGHVVDQQRSTAIAGKPIPAIERTFTFFDSPDLGNWLVTKPTQTVTESTSADGETARREMFLVSDGIKLRSQTIPGPDDDVYKEERFDYDTRGRLTRVVTLTAAGQDPFTARQTFTSYDGPGGIYPSSVETTPDVNVHQTMDRTWRHPAFGHVVQRVDANNVLQRSTFDTSGRPLSTSDTRTGTVNFTYAFLSAATRWQVTKSFGNEKQIDELDVLGRVVRHGWTTTPGTTVFETRGYDALGHLSSVKSTFFDGNNYEMTYVDDALDRPVSRCTNVSRKLTPAGAQVPPAFECTTYTYDGRKITVRKPEDTLSETLVDEAGRAVSITRRDVVQSLAPETTTFNYGPFDRYSSVVRPSGSVIAYDYDVKGRVQTMTRFPNVKTYAYDSFDNVVLETHSKHASIAGTSPQVQLSFSRDLAGRPVFSSAGSFDWDTAPNGAWRIASSTSPDGVTTTHTFNANAMPESDTWQIGAEAFAFGRTYDAKGRLDTLTYPQAGTFGRLRVKYNYNQFTGLTESIVDVGTAKVLWQADGRNAVGQLRDETMNGGVIKRSTRYYEGALLPATASFQSGTSPAFTENLQYRAGGNLERRTATLGTSVTAERFTYDALDRLWQWYAHEPAAIPVSYNYTRGELASRSAADETVTYTSTQLPGSSTSPFIERMALANLRTGVTESYDADALGRVTASPAGRFTYTAYDLPRRFTATSGATTDYVYDAYRGAVKKTFSGGGEEIALSGLFRRIKSGTATTYEHALQVEGQIVGAIEHRATAYANVEFYHRDQVGSPRAVAVGTAAVVRTPTRDPFGNQVNPSQPYLPADLAGVAGGGYHGFQQHRHDLRAGLIDMNGRYYSPRIGRFMSDDPVVGDALRGEAYDRKMFVYNDPVQLMDPTGFCVEQNCHPPGGDPPPGDVVPGDKGSNWENLKSMPREIAKEVAEWDLDDKLSNAKDATVTWADKHLNPFYTEPRGPSVPSAPTTPVAGTGAPTGVRGGSGSPHTTPETTSGMPIDLAGQTASFAKEIAPQLPVRFYPPPTIPFAANPPPFKATLSELDANPFLKNYASSLPGSAKATALNVVRGADPIMTTVSTGISWSQSIDAFQRGDHHNGSLLFLEGGFGYYAAMSGPLGLAASSVYFYGKYIFPMQVRERQTPGMPYHIGYSAHPLSASSWAP